jgi:peptide/nickel transport system permease protein
MAAFVGQRLAFGVVVLLAIVFLSYVGLSMARGAAFAPALSASLGDTVAYVGRVARGDLGRSAAASVTQASVTIGEVLPGMVKKSLGLLGVSLAVAVVVAVPLGVWAATRRRSAWSLMTVLVSIAGVSVPSFFAALLLQLGAIRLTKVLGARVVPVGGFGWDRHLILPALVLAARPIAQIYRVTYVTVGEVLEQDYVRTARSKGLRELLVMGRHVMGNAAIPILTTVGMSLRFSLSSLPVVEFFFGWPGVGFTLLKSISRQDDNLTVALVVCLGVLFIGVNVVLEGLYRLIDPRLRNGRGRSQRVERGGVFRGLRSLGVAIGEMVEENPLTRMLRRGEEEEEESPFRAVLRERGEEVEVSPGRYRAERIRSWLQATVTNVPFIVGSVLVAGLLVVFLWGPKIAPHSPYTTQGLVYEGSELSVPPFEPSEVHPWGTDVLGRDVMSLVLAGAQQTLLLAALVVGARLVVGVVLGAVAGWWSGSWVDRFLMGLSETLAAFPTLLLAMTFILALGIREGFRPFVIALCLVGWGEVMQFVRGEVMSIRPRLYIEGAVAVGLTTPRIIVSHVLPNLLSPLISITSLEMGAVLMLLGELGFVGIFIGGGAFAELQWMAPPYHYSDVPEWGALLSNVRRYTLSYPWMAIYPSLAFFVAILGFNLLGEGVRRLIESIGVVINRLVNRYTIAAAVLVVVGIGWVQANTGATAFYQQQARVFDGAWAYEHARVLAHPMFEGRALGTQGMDAAAYHIAQQFEALGLQAAGEDMTYFQTRKRSFALLDAAPALVIEDAGPPLSYRQDFVEYPSFVFNAGRGRGEVRVLAFGTLLESGARFGTYGAVDQLDLSGDVILLLDEADLEHVRYRSCAAILMVAEDSIDLRRRHTLSARRRSWSKPTLWISESTANRLLAQAAHTVADLRQADDNLGTDEVLDLRTGVMISMEVEASERDNVPVRHVLGQLPGQAAHIEGAPQADAAKLDHQLVVVMAQYDAPPPTPDDGRDDQRYPAANDNASGVAVMLEAIRAMHESGYEPYRSFLFVAYTGEGQEGGEWVSPVEVEEFLRAKKGFSENFEVEAVVNLRGLGAGTGEGVVISAGGSLRLADLLERAAGQMGVSSRRSGDPIDISIVFEEKELGEEGQKAPDVGLSWEEWEAMSRTPADTIASISRDKLEESGRTLSLALMILGRERQY